MLDYQAIIKSDTATRLLNVFTFEYSIWTVNGISEAVKRILLEKNTLFYDLRILCGFTKFQKFAHL